MPYSFIDSLDIPNEGKLLVLRQFPQSELRRLSRVSRMWNLFLSDDHVWLYRLKTDFYLTTQEAQHLKQHLNTSYKQVYYYCSLDLFEKYDPMFLNAAAVFSQQPEKFGKIDNSSLCELLAEYGFTLSHLRGRYWVNEQAKQWLIRLIDEMAYDVPTALSLVFEVFVRKNGISETKLQSIYHKHVFSKAEAETLQEAIFELKIQCKRHHEESLEGLSLYQLSALVEFQQEQITVMQVRAIRCVVMNFIPALGTLLRCENLPVDTAINVLNNSSDHEIRGLELELPLVEIKELTNRAQMEALARNKSIGLTVDHLKGQDWFDSSNYVYALENFHKSMMMDYISVLNILRSLTSLQAYFISIGFSNACVSELNVYQLMAIESLWPKINPSRSSENWCNISFQYATYFKNNGWFNSHHHVNAFRYLFARYNFTIPELLAAIDNTNWIQILEITFFLYKNQNNLNKLPAFKIIALLQLFKEGLTIEHYQQYKDCLNSPEQTSKLITLVKHDKHTLNHALSILKTTDSSTTDMTYAP